jgi:hypothetical protein
MAGKQQHRSGRLVDVRTRMANLASLREEGVVTQEEYHTMRMEIIRESIGVVAPVPSPSKPPQTKARDSNKRPLKKLRLAEYAYYDKASSSSISEEEGSVGVDESYSEEEGPLSQSVSSSSSSEDNEADEEEEREAEAEWRKERKTKAFDFSFWKLYNPHKTANEFRAMSHKIP